MVKDYDKINDYLLFSLLAPNIGGRIQFQNDPGRTIFQKVNLGDINIFSAYDVECTVSYIFRDRPVLTVIGNRMIAAWMFSLLKEKFRRLFAV
ncbi:MAG: hypothetical protein J7M09_06785 [Deltaproteobacteria bacterium]|nr:hypothetical protein [Candidatus Tharpella sp.]